MLWGGCPWFLCFGIEGLGCKTLVCVPSSKINKPKLVGPLQMETASLEDLAQSRDDPDEDEVEAEPEPM